MTVSKATVAENGIVCYGVFKVNIERATDRQLSITMKSN